ncbi:hypothetical protein jhhlp_004651 [Lomentospora prolificans]|uniref:Uncharacterized protein n=1 Tax=Lomentospora prolificans TaxID=41688 RepID=A0A2N3NC37_9PEZI|nr:hypothetical protein jhhlp_004651 [Lomentospora prolificans]
MTSNSISPIRQAWYKWKSPSLCCVFGLFVPPLSFSSLGPQTNTTLLVSKANAKILPTLYSNPAGFDLKGYTYWEFRIAGSDPSSRWRRIVHYPRSTHYSEVKVSPEWHQWLRYMRPNPPTLDEQRAEISRQERLKMLAAQADARWEAKPKLMQDAKPREDTLTMGPAVPSVEGHQAGEADPVAAEQGRKVVGKSSTRTVAGATTANAAAAAEDDEPEIDKADPWAGAKAREQNADWQPQAWTPSKAKR